MRKLKFSLMVAGLTVLCLGVGAAKASATTYNLTSNHCSDPAPCGAPGTIFGTVTLTQNGTVVDVTVALNSPYVWAKTGSADFMMFKFNGVNVNPQDISVNQTWPGQTLAPQSGTFTGDGTGFFAFGIACVTCGNGISTFSGSLTFHVADAVIADLSGTNSNGNVFVADLGNSTNGATGPIDASVCTGDLCPTVVPHIPDAPEPTTLVLLGSGLFLATRGIRRRLSR